MTSIRQFQKFIRVFVLFALSFFIASCGTQLSRNPESTDETLWYRWGLSGKISIKVNASNQNANVLWESEANDYQILLYGPLGQGKITIEKTAEQLSLKQNGKVHYADSSEKLLLETTGLELPISSLSYWIRGLASPHADAEVKKSYEGKIESMSQQGWSIRYASYYDADEWINKDLSSSNKRNLSESKIAANLFPSKALYLPRKIVLNKMNRLENYPESSSTDSRQIKVIIVIKEWQP